MHHEIHFPDFDDDDMFQNSRGLSNMGIVTIVLAVLGLVVVIVLICKCCQRRTRGQVLSAAPPPPPPGPTLTVVPYPQQQYVTATYPVPSPYPYPPVAPMGAPYPTAGGAQSYPQPTPGGLHASPGGLPTSPYPNAGAPTAPNLTAFYGIPPPGWNTQALPPSYEQATSLKQAPYNPAHPH